MALYKITKVKRNMSYAEMYAEQVLKMHSPKDEIEWLFSKLDKEEQENLIEIFELDVKDYD